MNDTVKKQLRDAVKEAFTNAKDGGYEDFVLTSDPYDVAEDMINNDATVEELVELHEIDISEVEEMVLELQKENA